MRAAYAAAARLVPFATIPVALGAGATLLLVNVLPARRARDVPMLVSLLLQRARAHSSLHRAGAVAACRIAPGYRRFPNLQSPVPAPPVVLGRSRSSRSSRADAICSTERPGRLPWPARCCSAPLDRR